MKDLRNIKRQDDGRGELSSIRLPLRRRLNLSF